MIQSAIPYAPVWSTGHLGERRGVRRRDARVRRRERHRLASHPPVGRAQAALGDRPYQPPARRHDPVPDRDVPRRGDRSEHDPGPPARPVRRTAADVRLRPPPRPYADSLWGAAAVGKGMGRGRQDQPAPRATGLRGVCRGRLGAADAHGVPALRRSRPRRGPGADRAVPYGAAVAPGPVAAGGVRAPAGGEPRQGPAAVVGAPRGRGGRVRGPGRRRDRRGRRRTRARVPPRGDPSAAGRAALRTRPAVLRGPVRRRDRGCTRLLGGDRQVADLARPGPVPERARPGEAGRRC